MVFDKLITSFQVIHTASQSHMNDPEALAKHRNCQERCKSMISTSGSGSGIGSLLGNNAATDKHPALTLADYQIESSGEWSRVVDMLVSIQLSKLDKLLTKVRARVSASKECVQVQIMQQQEDRLRKLKACFEQGTRYPAC
jgi:hypothetical protein